MRMKLFIESICYKDLFLNDVVLLLKEIGLNVNSNDYIVMCLYNLYEMCLKLDELLLLIIYKVFNLRVSII